jgi:hypothetical protein
MVRLVIVVIASAVIAASVLLHKNAIGLSVGIAIGTWYFLQAVVLGGGIATVRITQDPGVPRKPGDPNGSVGMGLAAAGIAASVLGLPDFAPYRAYFIFFLIAGLAIALGYAINGVVRQSRARRDGAGTKPDSAI